MFVLGWVVQLRPGSQEAAGTSRGEDAGSRDVSGFVMKAELNEVKGRRPHLRRITADESVETEKAAAAGALSRMQSDRTLLKCK